MPCLAVYCTTAMEEEDDEEMGSCAWLRQRLCLGSDDDDDPVLVVDTRPQDDYDVSHVRTAINVTLPASTLMMRRLAHGKLGLHSLVRPPASCRTFADDCKTHTIIIYGQLSQMDDVTSSICARLRQDGCTVFTLKGQYRESSSSVHSIFTIPLLSSGSVTECFESVWHVLFTRWLPCP